ncbi:MAG TPA: GxxExxY protein [Polyangiaceae bacterium]
MSGPEPTRDEDEVAAVVVDAAIEVHRHLGPAFAESVYENALSRELMMRGVVFERQVVVPVHYKDAWVGEGRIDMVVAGVLVAELKALPEIAAVHVCQALSYLKATGLRLALVLNFGMPRMQSGIRRVVRTR